uniref:Uncharacterized protein LOC111114306 n=1 Tax=Crassostrea virginica TaxID=6565 RepID=A0A8B8BZN6_CRAVI|nr:uncharacterized protein LOC111114306 [Crassostrea virginica]
MPLLHGDGYGTFPKCERFDVIAVFLCFLFTCFAGCVDNNPIVSSAHQSLRFSLAELQNIAVSIQEANRCRGQTGSCLCPWEWVPDVDVNRIPRTIYKAVKLPGSECESDPDMLCQGQNKRFNVYHLRQTSTGSYRLRPGVRELPVAMACVKKVQRPVENGEHAYSDIRD